MKKNPIIGIIGGSGLYNIEGLSNNKWQTISTPFGKTSDKIYSAQYSTLKIMFIPRHGRNHQLPPHRINYRANIYALKKLCVTDIISISAVGSLKKNHKPGDFILVDQFLDRTLDRPRTFFDKDLVAHVSLANPISKDLSDLIYQSRKNNKNIKIGGTYIAIEGPQFSTYAESILFKSWNCDVIGMTNMPEARLCREAELGYASISMVTDFDCWNKSHEEVTVEQVIKIMQNNTKKVQSLLLELFKKILNLDSWNWNNPIYNNLNNAIITNTKNVSRKTLKDLSPIIKRYLKEK